jgi:hypothetical protein
MNTKQHGEAGIRNGTAEPRWWRVRKAARATQGTCAKASTAAPKRSLILLVFVIHK